MSPVEVSSLFFGDPWDAPAVDWSMRTDTPVGEHCLSCAEPIAEGDRGWIRVVADYASGDGLAATRVPVHAECDLRGVSGHQVGVCPCQGYGTDRAAARLCWERVGEQRGVPLEQLTAPSRWSRDPDGSWVHEVPREV